MQDDNSKITDCNKSVAELLHRLSGREAGAAWAEFLDRYAQLIMNTANQFEYEPDRINDCFLFVCEKLNDNRFRRLLKFNTRGTAKFSTWLTTVTFNLCVDWHRHEYGRVTMLPTISALPVFDQSVYRLVIEQDMDKESCFQTLIADYPDLTRELISIALKRIYSILTPRQRWQISVRNRGRKRAGSDPLQGHTELLPDPESGPDKEAQAQQELDSIHQAMAALPTDQRLLLKLRFQEGLSLVKIAELTQLGDSNRVWRQIQAAIATVRQQIHTDSSQTPRKN
jgi:RNA polymerase sigma factor (sigma-70 family)